MRNPWLWTAVLVLAVFGLIIWLSRTIPQTGNLGVSHLIYLFVVLFFVAGSVFADRRLNLSRVIKYSLAWVGIFLALVTGYVFWEQFVVVGREVKSGLAPALATQDGEGQVILSRQQSGHFGTVAKVNGTRINVMVDTGASDVALTYEDAERAGLEPWNLTFDRPYQTANGVTYGATVDIQSITIGDITVYNVKGSVMKDGMSVSLLGLSYLDRLSSYQVTGHKMILTQ